ncbi:MAG: cobalt-precorrin-8X methylmutase [Symploca sp. SIO2B6]|nr:cobalt-precorrin-8X methylmutase [Symploca sp. SIO2B6]
MTYLNHPITQQSFAIIDREIGTHSFTPEQYAVVRRVIHSTADFEFQSLVSFSTDVIRQSIAAFQQGNPIITDVGMVQQGIKTVVAQTFGNPVIVAVEQAPSPLPGRTRTESGMLMCLDRYPNGIFVIGNAPTALLAICNNYQHQKPSAHPSLIIGAPVGFVAVEQSKIALSQTRLPHIQINGRKGGSSVAAAIVNALLLMAWDQR